MIRTSKDQIVENQNVEKNVESVKMTFDVLIFLDAIGNISFAFKLNFRRTDITYGVKKDQNIESLKMTFDVLIFDVLFYFRCSFFDFQRSDFRRSDPFPNFLVLLLWILFLQKYFTFLQIIFKLILKCKEMKEQSCLVRLG